MPETLSHTRHLSRRPLFGPAFALLAVLCGTGCGSDEQGGAGGAGAAGQGGGGGGAGGASAQDILTTDLALDMSALTGKASVLVRPAAGANVVTLDVGGLTLSSVTLDGVPVQPQGAQELVNIPSGSSTEPVMIELEYAFSERTLAMFDGWMPSQGVTFIWPYFCGNLFPCEASPVDGVTFTMELTGLDPSLTAIYTKSTYSDAPSYMPAVAIGNYEKLDVGVTSAGTKLSAWYFAGAEGLADAQMGTEHLTQAFDFFEKTYGPYAFGPEAGTVEVDWGADSYGGMEHHPFFHVAMYDFWNEEAQVHEAAHAWFGDGVRLACWEDFVLSEGTTTYITAHALERVNAPDQWGSYVEDYLTPICTGEDTNAIVLPSTCNEIDLLTEDLWSLAPYMKGACFYEDVADLIGQDAVDEVIRDFYQKHVGNAARMRDMIDALEAKAGAEHKDAIETLVNEWLLTLACPPDYANRCRNHQTAARQRN